MSVAPPLLQSPAPAAAGSRLPEQAGRPWLLAGMVALAALAVSPIWRSRFLPLLDEPNHLASIYIYRYLPDASAHLAAYYTRSFRFVPYMVYHLVVLGLSYLVPVELANKLWQSLYVLSFPAAALVWTRRTGRSPLLALFALPLGYSYTWALGFAPFNASVPCLLFAISALDAFLEGPTAGRALLLILVAFLCELGHPLIFAGLCAAAIALGALHLMTPLRVLIAALAFVPSLVALRLQMADGAASPFVADVAQADVHSIAGTWSGWRDMLANLPSYSLDVVSGRAGQNLFWVLVATCVALVLSGLRRSPAEALRSAGHDGRPTRAQRIRAALDTYRTLLIATALLLCYLLFPLHLSRPFDWWFVSGRYAIPFLFFLLLSPRGALTGLRRWALAPVLVASIAFFLIIGGRYADYARRIEPLFHLAGQIPPNDTAILLSMQPRTDPAVDVEAYREISSYLQLIRGGFSPSGFYHAEHPLHLAHAPPMPPWSAHEAFDFRGGSVFWDWLVIHGRIPPALPASGVWTRVASEGDFSLYRRAGTSRSGAGPLR